MTAHPHMIWRPRWQKISHTWVRR